MSTVLVATGTQGTYTLEGVYGLLLNHEAAKEQKKKKISQRKLKETFKGSNTALMAKNKSRSRDIYGHTGQVYETKYYEPGQEVEDLNELTEQMDLLRRRFDKAIRFYSHYGKRNTREKCSFDP